MTILNALPGIVPTARTFTTGQWPQKRMKMRNARTVRWGLCNKPSGDKMDLIWENITYAQAESICIVWDNSYGLYGTLALPPVPNVEQVAGLTPEILGGTSGALKDLLTLPFANTTWHLSSPPQVQAVKAGRCTVKIAIKLRFADAAMAIGSGGGYGPTLTNIQIWRFDGTPRPIVNAFGETDPIRTSYGAYGVDTVEGSFNGKIDRYICDLWYTRSDGAKTYTANWIEGWIPQPDGSYLPPTELSYRWVVV